MTGHLLEQARQGDRAAFETLVDDHAPLGWRLAYALCGTDGDAARALTEGASRAFGPGSSLFATTRAPVELCHRVRLASIDALAERPTQRAFVIPPWADEDLALSFADLPERSRTALWLHGVEGFSPAGSAAVLDVPVEYVDGLVERARDGLRTRVLLRHVQTHGARNCDRAIDRLPAHAAGRLPDEEVALVERHLRLCTACQDRHDRLATLADHLPAIVPPMPDLGDDVRAAWLALTPPATSRGLSSLAEKLIAGISAGAAAVGVVGAAMAAGTEGEEAGEVVPTEAVVADLGGSAGASGDSGPPGTPPGRTPFEPTPVSDADLSAALSQDRDDVVPTTPTPAPPEPSAGATDPAPAPASPRSDTAPSVDSATADAPAPPVPDEPLVSVGTDVGDVPVAVDVGADSGVTVGPISVGSGPQPGDDLLEVGGPLDDLGL